MNEPDMINFEFYENWQEELDHDLGLGKEEFTNLCVCEFLFKNWEKKWIPLKKVVDYSVRKINSYKKLYEAHHALKTICHEEEPEYTKNALELGEKIESNYQIPKIYNNTPSDYLLYFKGIQIRKSKFCNELSCICKSDFINISHFHERFCRSYFNQSDIYKDQYDIEIDCKDQLEKAEQSLHFADLNLNLLFLDNMNSSE